MSEPSGAVPGTEAQPPLADAAPAAAARRRAPAVALLVVLAAAAAARAWLLFGTPLVPGMNGGYYLVQARALLLTGGLGIPDLPLTFMLQAALAWLLNLATGLGFEASIVLAVKLTDTLLPPLAAVPLFLVGRAWCRRAGRGVWPAAAAAAALVLAPAILNMAGDFQKNSLGLVWLAGLAWALHHWMTRRTARSSLGALAMLGLCGLTHIGVFGAALLLTALVWGADFVIRRRERARRRWGRILAAAAAALAVAILAAGIVLWKFDPTRVQRLASAFADPAKFLRGEGPGAPGGPGRGGPDRGPPGDRQVSGRTPMPTGGPGRGPGGPPMGPPGFLMMPLWLVRGLFVAVAAGAFILPWRRRRALPPADRALAAGSAVCLIALSGPWVGGDVVMRFMLIATVPAAFAGVYALVHLPGRWLPRVVAAAVMAWIGFRTVPFLARGGRPIITEEAAAELRTLASKIAEPSRTLVVARHGLEWWTAWTLHTRVAQARALRVEDWTTYDAVLFLQEKGGPGGGQRFGGPDGGRPRGGRPGGRTERAFPGDAPPWGDGPADFRGPSPGFGGGPPPDFGGPPPGFPPMGRGPPGAGGFGGPPPMMQVLIPPGSEILHDGTQFTLARVPEPPPFVGRDEADDAAKR